MPVDTLVTNGTIVTPDGPIEGDIAIDGETIVELGIDSGARPDRVIDAGGRYVLPGVVENHGHPGSKDHISTDFRTETPGAAAGGLTTWGCIVRSTRMGQELDQERFPGKPVAEPTPEDAVSWHEVFELGKRAGEENSVVDFFFDYVINTEEHAAEIPEYVEQHGVTGFKIFGNLQANADAPVSPWQARLGFPVPFDEGLFYRTFEQVAEVGPPAKVAIHNENAQVCSVFTKRLREAGRADLSAWMEHSPGFAEAEHIRRYGYFAEQTGAPMYVVHLTSKEGLTACRRLKRNPDVDITVETCPHYLTRTVDDAPHGEPLLLKVSPPIRDERQSEVLWEGLADGTIDCLGTDHVVTPRAEKLRIGSDGEPTTSVWEAGSGLVGVEYLLPLMLSEGVNRGRIGLERLVEVTAENTARSAGIFPRKGAIRPGSDADLVIVDLEETRTVNAEEQHSSVSFAAYNGMELQGWPVLTMVRGNMVYEDGEVVGHPGHGTYVPRSGE